MILERLSIVNFKNIADAQMNFSSRLNCFTGFNGMGKTNILDAIHYLSVGRSFNGVADSLVIRNDADMMLLKGNYTRRNEKEEITMGLQRGHRKILRRNGKDYRRLSEHLGLLPVVMVSPMDWDIIRGASEERRHLIDLIISQSDNNYLHRLISYNKALSSRNAMLRDGVTDELMYLSIENTLIQTATYIHKVRSEKLLEFTPIFNDYYRRISGEADNVSLGYISALNEAPMQQILDTNRMRDKNAGFTTAGIHRDDIEMTINNMPMRKVGSQGQCKTYTLALRLAQYDILKRHTGINPLLLLDDIFDKLDSSRVGNIISIVSSDNFGQIFITDTDRTYLDEIIAGRGGSDYRMFSVSNGICHES